MQLAALSLSHVPSNLAWVALPESVGERLWSLGLTKGSLRDPQDGGEVVCVSVMWKADGAPSAGRPTPKYIKRVPKAGGGYRYYYAAHECGGVHNAAHFDVGSSFAHGGGHFHVKAVGPDGMLHVEHSHAPGQRVQMTHAELAQKLQEHHAPALETHRKAVLERFMRDIGQAAGKRKEALEKKAAKYGYEKPQPKVEPAAEKKPAEPEMSVADRVAAVKDLEGMAAKIRERRASTAKNPKAAKFNAMADEELRGLEKEIADHKAEIRHARGSEAAAQGAYKTTTSEARVPAKKEMAAPADTKTPAKPAEDDYDFSGGAPAAPGEGKKPAPASASKPPESRVEHDLVSSNVKHVSWDPEKPGSSKGKMRVHFDNGAVHDYEGVHHDDYRKVVDAHGSHGKAFNEHIKGLHPSTKVKDADKGTLGKKAAARQRETRQAEATASRQAAVGNYEARQKREQNPEDVTPQMAMPEPAAKKDAAPAAPAKAPAEAPKGEAKAAKEKAPTKRGKGAEAPEPLSKETLDRLGLSKEGAKRINDERNARMDRWKKMSPEDRAAHSKAHAAVFDALKAPMSGHGATSSDYAAHADRERKLKELFSDDDRLTALGRKLQSSHSNEHRKHVLEAAGTKDTVTAAAQKKQAYDQTKSRFDKLTGRGVTVPRHDAKQEAETRDLAEKLATEYGDNSAKESLARLDAEHKAEMSPERKAERKAEREQWENNAKAQEADVKRLQDTLRSTELGSPEHTKALAEHLEKHPHKMDRKGFDVGNEVRVAKEGNGYRVTRPDFSHEDSSYHRDIESAVKEAHRQRHIAQNADHPLAVTNSERGRKALESYKGIPESVSNPPAKSEPPTLRPAEPTRPTAQTDHYARAKDVYGLSDKHIQAIKAKSQTRAKAAAAKGDHEGAAKIVKDAVRDYVQGATKRTPEQIAKWMSDAEAKHMNKGLLWLLGSVAKAVRRAA